AAARHLSIKRAAQELHVTPAAISQQVKVLETWLQTPVFSRARGTLRFTPAGEALFPFVRDALDTMTRAAEEAASTHRGRVLRLGCIASFAAKWLVPRLHDFRKHHPDIDVWLLTEDRVT